MGSSRDTNENDSLAAKELRAAADRQKATIESWRRPIEPCLFETARAIDNVFCSELFYNKNDEDIIDSCEKSIMGWGVNRALDLMIPDELYSAPFRLFESIEGNQKRADNLLFHCGALNRAELYSGWLDDGLVSARLDTPQKQLSSGIRNILVLKTKSSSLYDETIASKNLKWVSSLISDGDQPWEASLKIRFDSLLPELKRRVRRLGQWGIAYTTSDEVDRFFLECGQVYLRRIWSSDLVGLDDKFNGEEFRAYLGVLAAISGRSQKQLCYASILKSEYPNLDIRNLLTSYCPCDEFYSGLAGHLDADVNQVEKLMKCMVLGPENKRQHLTSGDMAFAPIIRATKESFILPMYGLEINPFFFLLRDLQGRYKDDWFQASNNREKRWIDDLKTIFQDKKWVTVGRSVNLKDDGRVVTDVDFLAYDLDQNELSVFQLKWQQPFGMDNRTRRSMGKNFIAEGNRWTDSVLRWLEKYGVNELAYRAGIKCQPGAGVQLFVIGRYNAFFSGYDGRDGRAAWCDWNHFMKQRLTHRKMPIRKFVETLDSENQSLRRASAGESYMFPVDDLAIILNPSSEPGGPVAAV